MCLTWFAPAVCVGWKWPTTKGGKKQECYNNPASEKSVHNVFLCLLISETVRLTIQCTQHQEAFESRTESVIIFWHDLMNVIQAVPRKYVREIHQIVVLASFWIMCWPLGLKHCAISGEVDWPFKNSKKRLPCKDWAQTSLCCLCLCLARKKLNDLFVFPRKRMVEHRIGCLIYKNAFVFVVPLLVQ